MQVGAQIPFSEDNMRFLAQFGVEQVDPLPSAGLGMGLGLEEDGVWRAEALLRLREQVESFGLTFGAAHLPLSAAGIEQQIWPHIMLGTPERDREIDQCCQCIVAAAKAGIPLLLYNLSMLHVVRSAPTVGRGGVLLSHFNYDDLKDDPPIPGRTLTADQAWERISYFVERVVPVAEEYGVRLGCHQHDPAMPADRGYRGVQRVLGSIEGLKRFVELSPSPYHGLNFCQGTVSEMCDNAEQVYEAIRYFGERGRIFWVHFRNIRGRALNFEEVYPDEGDIDMVRAFRTYLEAGYDGVLVPDHVPQADTDTRYGHRGHAFCFGYIRGLIQCIQGTQA